MFIDILFHIETKTWSCLYSFSDCIKLYQMESMMGGYNILRESIDDSTKLYSGNFDSKDRIQNIFRMYGYKINLTIE